MHVSSLRMGRPLVGARSEERVCVCGGWTFVARERMWLKCRNYWLWWGLFIPGPMARNGEVVWKKGKGVGVG